MKPLKIGIILMLLSFAPALQARGADSLLSFNWKWTPILVSPADTLRIESIIRKADQYLYTHSDSAALLIHKAMLWSRKKKYPDGIAKSLLTMGRYYMTRNKFEQALQSFKEAYPYCQRALFGKPQLMITWQNDMAKPYAYLGITDTALSYLLQAKKNAIALKDTGALIHTYSNLGILWLSDHSDFESSIQNLQYARELSENFHDYELASIYSKLASIYGVLNDTVKLIHYANKALDIAIRTGDIPTERFAIKQIGSYYMKTGQYEQATKSFHKALEMQDASNPSSYFSAYWGISESHFWLKEYKQSLPFARKALAIIRYQKRLDLVSVSFYNFLSQLYYNSGDYRQAFRYKTYYSQLSDSLNNIKKEKALYQLKIKSQIDEKDKEIAQKQLSLLQQQSHIKNRNILIVVISSTFFLIVGLFWAYYRNTHRKIYMMRQQEEINMLKASTYGEEQERTRVARDLHDGVSSLLSAAAINLNALASDYGIKEADRFSKTKYLLEEANSEIRKMAHNLMPYTLLQHDLPTAVKLYCSYMFPTDTLPQVKVRSFGRFDVLDKDILLILYRIVQELVQNIIKHAGATQAFIQLHIDPQLLSITVEDDGKGFNRQNKGRGIGLSNIEARVRNLNGQISIETSLGKGVSVYIEFDLKEITKTDTRAHGVLGQKRQP